MTRTFLIAIAFVLAACFALATDRSAASAPPDAGLSPSTSDADRGCCVWKSSPVRCTFTNRGYCRTKAEQAGIAFDFHEGTNCAAVSACPGNSPSSRYLSPTFMTDR